MAAKSGKGTVKEPSVIIKPLGSTGGLDSIHIVLTILVVILIALLLAVAHSKPIVVTNSTNSTNPATTCAYGTVNGKCAVPMHTSGQIRQAAENFLASYNYLNTSLSLIPYISDVSRMNLTYNPANSEWYVSVPIQNLGSNQTLQFAMLVSDKNTSQVTPLIQTLKSSLASSNYVVAKGVVQLAGQTSCGTGSPLQVYWFVDPYSPGGISSLANNMTALRSRFQSKINATVKILYTQYSQSIGSAYGLDNSLALGNYLFCASSQNNFPQFLGGVAGRYNGSYMPSSLLSGMANRTGLNGSSLNSCLDTAGTYINRQALLAKYYNITSTPAVVTDCRYLSIPQTAINAIFYANSSI